MDDGCHQRPPTAWQPASRREKGQHNIAFSRYLFGYGKIPETGDLR